MRSKPFRFNVLIGFLVVVTTIPAVFADVNDGLIHHWPMDGNASDLVGAADGFPVGSPAYVPGLDGQAIHVSEGNHIRIPSTQSWYPGMSSFTISLFFNHIEYHSTVDSNWFVVVQGGDFAEGVSFSISRANPVLGLQLQPGAFSVPPGQDAFAPISLDGWKHAVAVLDRDNQRVQLYIDGIKILDDPLNLGGDMSIDPTRDMLIGAYDYIPPVRGGEVLLDDIRIYERALSAAEVGCLMFFCDDPDEDGICGPLDNCPQQPNPMQSSSDGDLLGDACDNCPLDDNADQMDRDEDGIGDVCDPCTDADEDGFGSPGSAACPGGATSDCDDLDAGNSPGNSELCDGRDNDCDGVVPAEEADSDGDGFRVCENDCSDGMAAINPDAFEIPGNHTDENCDGSLGACDPTAGWRNHGQFVRCVAQECEALVAEGLLTEEECDVFVSQAARSDVGKK